MNWVHLEDRVLKARKLHQCYLCGKQIAKDEKYIRRSGIHEGYGYRTAKMHTACEEQTHDWDIDDWETFSPGDLANWVEDTEAKGGEA